MNIKRIELKNYGPFLLKQEFDLRPVGKPKKNSPLDKEQVLPLSVIYGPNNSGKSILLDVFKKIKDLMAGEYVDFNKNFEEDKPCEISIYFDDFCFEISNEFATHNATFTLYKLDGEVIVRAKDPMFLQDAEFAPIQKLASRIYFADDSLTYDKELVEFLTDNLEEVANVLDSAGFNVDDFNLKTFMHTFMGMNENQTIPEGTGRISDADHVYYFNIKYGNGREQLLDNSSNSLKRFVKLMPMLIPNDRYDIIVVDDVFNSLHTCLLEEIVKAHVSRDDKKQLIFNTNNTHLLNLVEEDGIRKDEIYFINHNRRGASSIYSLADFKVENSKWGKDFEKRYLEGRMDATPLIFSTQL